MNLSDELFKNVKRICIYCGSTKNLSVGINGAICEECIYRKHLLNFK